MNKKLLELLDKINSQKTLVQSLAEEGKLDEAEQAKIELQNMQKKFDILKDVLDDAHNAMANSIQTGVDIPGVRTVEPTNDVKPDAIREFANAARARFQNQMSEGSNADGGYTVPEDIQTRINEYRDAKYSLLDEVDREPVTTSKGARTFKKRAQQTGFSEVGEGGKITAKSTPQFERISYEIKKYAGYMPVTNELFADSDANISNTLIAWIGDESRVTRNKLILKKVATKAPVEMKSLDDIKKALNVTLGQAFKPTSKVITNDDGLQWLDTLKDATGRDLLQPDPTNPAKQQLRAGATIVKIRVIPNDDLPSDTTEAGKRKIPMIVGDLKEGIKFFDRNKLSIMTSNVAAIGTLNAFEEDLTIFRATEREDVQIKDDKAFVNGQVTIDDATVVGE